MKTLKESVDIVVNEYPKVKPGVIAKIIERYHKAMMETLIKYGHLYISPEIKLEIIPITPRRYKLRGIDYQSKRVYKIKATIASDKYYEAIAEEYNLLRDDLD